MHIYLCIDDTDNIDSIGTGTIADYIKISIKEQLSLKCSMTTRHQLFIHEDIPYTSHNSSMCFVIETNYDVEASAFESLIHSIKEIAVKVIVKNMADGSDPGLCIAYELGKEYKEKLIAFGKQAKSEIKTKEQAYQLAKQCNIHLSEHGGTGMGIIGAIAGVGLRISGNDGEVKGGLKDIKCGVYSVDDLLARDDIELIYNIQNKSIVTKGDIRFNTRSKSVLRNHHLILYVQNNQNAYTSLNKRYIRQMETRQMNPISAELVKECNQYKPDVLEEQLDESKSCMNCMYRRWINKDLICIKNIDA